MQALHYLTRCQYKDVLPCGPVATTGRPDGMKGEGGVRSLSETKLEANTRTLHPTPETLVLPCEDPSRQVRTIVILA